jgi:hypothetical protein
MKKTVLLAMIVLGLMCSAAYAGAPRWYGKEPGALVPFGGGSGLTEVSSEPLTGAGQLKLHTTKESACIAKTHLTIANPTEGPGTSSIDAFTIVCEEGTGPGLNSAEPYPCTANGEGMELRATGLPWAGVLEIGESKGSGKGGAVRNLPRYYDVFTARFELECLKNQATAVYSGALRVGADVGRLALEEKSGELTDGAGHGFTLKGTDWIASEAFADVRVNSVYAEQQLVQRL